MARKGTGGSKRPRLDQNTIIAANNEKTADFLRVRHSLEMRTRIWADIELAMRDYEAEEHRPMPPSRKAFEIQQALHREIYGVAPIDLEIGCMMGGPQRGQKIKQSGIALNREGGPAQFDVQLASGVTTKQGNSATDKALLRSVWDDGIYGGTTGVISPPRLVEMMRKMTRRPVFMPLANQGIAPALIFEQILRNNTPVDILFDDHVGSGSDLGDLKAAIIPREEGAVGIEIDRATVINTQYSCRGYMFHSPLTLESIQSDAGILGMEAEALGDMGAFPGHLSDYDIFMAIWYGLNTGYFRRYDATNNAWNVSTSEVPWGKADFITTNAYKHVAWFDYKNGKFYKPHVGANYLKYHNSVEYTEPIEVLLGFGSLGAKVYDGIKMLMRLHKRKHMPLDLVYLPSDFILALTDDERLKSKVYLSDNRNLRYAGEPGYKGTLMMPGLADTVELFEYEPGNIPVLASADAAPVTIDYLMIGATAGRVVQHAPFWPWSVMSMPELGVSGTVARPTLRNVLTGYSCECVEAYDLRAVSMIKCVSTAHA